MIGYLININSIRNKMVQWADICKTSSTEILCIDVIKLDSSFPRDQNSSGGGKIVYIRNGIVVNSLTLYKTQNTESICVEITIKKRKWEISFTCRPPNNNNLKVFFEETTQFVSQLLSDVDKIIPVGDFNIVIGSKDCQKVKHLVGFCHTFDLTNLINTKTCFEYATSQFSLDVILTNRPRSFQKTAAITTGLSDYHKMIIITLGSSYTREPPRNVIYRNYKHFNVQDFLNDL